MIALLSPMTLARFVGARNDFSFQSRTFLAINLLACYRPYLV
jgi:hypothetical protein